MPDRDGLFRVQNSPYWRASFIDASGRQIRRSTGETDRAKAAQVRAEWIAREGRHRAGSVHVVHRSFAEVMSEYLEAGRTLKGRPKTEGTRDRDRRCAAQLVAVFRDHYMMMEGHLDLTEYPGPVIDGAAVLRYDAQRAAAGIGPATRRRELATLGAAAQWCRSLLSWPVIDPTTRRKPAPPPGRDRWLTQEEAGRLLAAAKSATKAPWLHSFIICALHTGCRRNELLDLEWDRVDLGRRTIYLPAGGNKSRRVASVPLNTAAHTAMLDLARFRAAHCPGAPFVFSDWQGRHVCCVRTAWETAVRRAGLADLHIHDLRHTCATWLRQAGASLEDIGALLRHASPTMTARYAHAEPEQARSAVERLAPPRQDDAAGCSTRTWQAS